MLLQGEKLGTIEQRLDMVVQGASDMTRGDCWSTGADGNDQTRSRFRSAWSRLRTTLDRTRRSSTFWQQQKNANYYEMVLGTSNVAGIQPTDTEETWRSTHYMP